MRALTIHQPWAALVAAGIKLIENRPTRPMAAAIGTRIAIHAGLQLDGDARDLIDEIAPEYRDHTWRGRIGRRGEILATAMLVGYVERAEMIEYVARRSGLSSHDDYGKQSRWFFGPIGYLLADVRPLATPIAARGMQGFWPVPADVARQVLEQERAR